MKSMKPLLLSTERNNQELEASQDLVNSSLDQLIEDQEQLSFYESIDSSARGSSPKQKHKQQKQDETPKLVHEREIVQPLEKIFIIFVGFRQNLDEICRRYNCKLKISFKRLRILACKPLDIDQKKVQKLVQECRQYIFESISKIVYIQWPFEIKYKIYNSHYFKQSNYAIIVEGEQANLGMCKFNKKIIIYSDKMTEQKLKSISWEIFLHKKIFSVCFRRDNRKAQEIENNITKFLKLGIKHYQPEFQQRETIVEVSRNKCVINCIGKGERDVLACKAKVKNLIESTTIIVIRYEDKNELKKFQLDKISKYIQKVSPFPIFFNKIHSRCLTFISKQNILKSLFKKNNFLNLIKMNQRTELAMFFLRKSSFDTKKEAIMRICDKQGYDFKKQGGSYYSFQKLFRDEGEQNNIHEILGLLEKILIHLREIKTKWEVPLSKKSMWHRIQEIQENCTDEYYDTGEVVEEVQLSDLLRRDILMEKLKMGKNALVGYSLFQGQQTTPVYWYTTNNTDKQGKKLITECKPSQIIGGAQVPGREYFVGCKKMNNLNQIKFLYHGRIVVI